MDMEIVMFALEVKKWSQYKVYNSCSY